MALVLTQIDGNQSIGSSLSVINANYTAIQSAINGLEGVIDVATKKAALTALTVLPAGGIESSVSVLTGAAGSLLSVNPSAGGVTASINADGSIAGLKITTTSAIGDPSILTHAQIINELKILATTNGVTAKLVVDGTLDLNTANASITKKSKTIAIVAANVGAAAASKLSLAAHTIVYLDYDNGAVGLPSNSEVYIDTTAMLDGQVVEIICVRTNTNGAKLHNGAAGSEVFAVIDPANGIVPLADVNIPTFDTASGLARMTVICETIAGSKKLVILDSTNVTNV